MLTKRTEPIKTNAKILIIDFTEPERNIKISTRDNRKISFHSPPSAGHGMDEIHTDVGRTGH
jgi:hypothetical protein